MSKFKVGKAPKNRYADGRTYSVPAMLKAQKMKKRGWRK